MGRKIGRAVEVGAVAPGFPVQQPARRMIPGHELVVEEEMAVSGGSHPVFVGGAAKP